MKIINAIFAQNIGGVNQVFCNYNKVLSDLGHELLLLVSNNSEFKYQGKQIYRLKGFSPIIDFCHILFLLWLKKPDIMICHSLRLMKWGKYLKYFVRTKFVAVNHGMGYKKSLGCDYAINVNQEINDLLLKIGFNKDKSFVISNAIEIDAKYHTKLFSKTPVLGLYGRLDNGKGFDILIEATSILKKRGINFILKLGGVENPEGLGWKDIKKMAKDAGIYDNCQFAGKVVDKKLFFEDVDIFCLSSRGESFGLVILESFLHSTLVISSDTDGGKLLISHLENGLLFENHNSQDLANKIEHVINNKNIYHKLTNKAYEDLLKKYSLDILKKNLAKTLTAIQH